MKPMERKYLINLVLDMSDAMMVTNISLGHVIDTVQDSLCKRYLKWRDLFVQVVCVLEF